MSTSSSFTSGGGAGSAGSGGSAGSAGFRGFGARGFGGSGRGSATSLSDAFEQLRSVVEQRLSPRPQHDGDVRAAVLALLAEKPMHGYQIIAEIEQRSGGSWKPSAGSVYPTLQLLVDEGLISSEVTDGRKSYALTDAGRAEADAATRRGLPWEASGREFPGMGALPKSGMDLAHAVAQVQRTGSPEQVKEAVAVLVEARRKLYSILAQD